MHYDFDSQADVRPEAGELALAVAILQRAVEDHRHGRPRQREEARAFLRGVWFSFLADSLELDVEAARRRLGLIVNNTPQTASE